MDSTFFSVVPNNSLGKSAVRWLRSNDVHCTPMILTEPDETPSNRLGTYYLETGYGIRASKVIYDRKHSVITEYDFSQVDSGRSAGRLRLAAPERHHPGAGPQLPRPHPRHAQGRQEEGPDRQLRRQLPLHPLDLGGSPRLLHRVPAPTWTCCWALSPITCGRTKPTTQGRLEGRRAPAAQLRAAGDEIFQHFIERYPNLKCIARHVRYAHSGSENSLKAFMWYEGHTFESKLFTFNILDRVGGGDALPAA